MGEAGKRQRWAKEWERIIGEQEGSGRSIEEYCREKGLSARSLYGWRKRLSVKEVIKGKGFVELVPVGMEGVRTLRIETPGGYRIEVREGSEGEFLRRVLKAVEVR